MVVKSKLCYRQELQCAQVADESFQPYYRAGFCDASDNSHCCNCRLSEEFPRCVQSHRLVVSYLAPNPLDGMDSHLSRVSSDTADFPFFPGPCGHVHWSDLKAPPSPFTLEADSALPSSLLGKEDLEQMFNTQGCSMPVSVCCVRCCFPNTVQ